MNKWRYIQGQIKSRKYESHKKTVGFAKNENKKSKKKRMWWL